MKDIKVNIKMKSYNNTSNQLIMKTKQHSNMKRILLAIAMILMANGIVIAQTVEERKGGTSTYSVVAGDPTDEYTWTIYGDVQPASITPAPLPGGDGSVGNPYIVDWTAGQNTIQVTWGADASPDINSVAGRVSVQKRVTSAGAVCPSPVQDMDITFWSEPSAAIAGLADSAVCSADPIGGNITLNLTGAPDGGGNDGFNVVYDVAVSSANLSTTTAVGQPGTDLAVSTDGATVNIPRPEGLVNTGSAVETYTITLKSMTDDLDDGTGLPTAIVGQVYTITVYPTPSTGDITSSGSLTRR